MTESREFGGVSTSQGTAKPPAHSGEIRAPGQPVDKPGHTTHAKGKSDVVITPDWAAQDMLDHFRPEGVLLDPCRGPGAFHRLMPEGSPWCEISEGVDFFAWSHPVDWVIGNPPYSLTRPWFRHSYDIADHLVYLVPCRNVFSAYGFLREIHEYGGFREIRTYGTGGRLGFPMGNAIAAFHIERQWRGPTTFSFFDALPERLTLEGAA